MCIRDSPSSAIFQLDFSFDHLCDQFLRSLPSNRIIASLGGVVKLTELIFLGTGPHNSVSCGVCENKIQGIKKK